MQRTRAFAAAILILLSAAALALAAERAAEYPSFSGIYPHLAALSDSYSEAGIGAVVPWAERLWYVSYVAHKAGRRVGLYEITPELEFCRRPESIVGTHAGRMIHRESNQLIIGPYVIDAKGNVRVFDALARNERVTAIARHLADPARKVYVQAMEGKYYECDVYTLATKLLGDAKQELGVQGPAHFKGAYTSQGRYVVANNSYDGGDVSGRAHGRYPPREGRLAAWDGARWEIIHRTAFCDVTTAAGVDAAPDDDGPLWSIGWDKRSVLLAVLADGRWTTYRLPKGSQAYDQAWCTEWPRIRQVDSGRWMLDMHGLFYSFPSTFRPGACGGLEPWAYHLRMTPDFCPWQGRLVLAGDQNSSMNHRHRTGGQPQSNLLFTSLDELEQWGRPSGWGGPWLDDEVRAGVPSEPLLIHGFPRRCLHLVQGVAASEAVRERCTGAFKIVDLPPALSGLETITIARGSMQRPAPGYSFEVDRDVVVYLAVHQRGNPRLPDGWDKTDMVIEWRHGDAYTDVVYRRRFAPGVVEIPGHDGHNELNHYGVPHLCFLEPVAPVEGELQVSRLPDNLNARLSRQEAPRPGVAAAFAIEIDRQGTGEWSDYTTIRVPPGGYAWHVLPDDLPACWLRITSDCDTTASAQLLFGPRSEARQSPGPGPFGSLSPLTKNKPRIHGGLLPFADRLWLCAYRTGADGEPAEGCGLYQLDEDAKPVRRAESLPGVFANRKMVSGLLSIGPHLIAADGTVRTIRALADEHLTASIRHPSDADKMFFLAADGRLLEADLKTLAVRQVAEIARELGLDGAGLRFKSGHQAGNRVFVTAAAADGRSGCLAEWDGQRWQVIDRAAYGEVADWASMSSAVVATGWDRASALLKVRGGDGRWATYRLPKASGDYDTAWRSERPRIREVETERILMDVHGIFYETTGLAHAWFVRPIARHDRLVSDFCSWRGLTVLAGNDAGAESDAHHVAADGVGLWLGKTDDLWQLGRPTGEGGPWLRTPVEAGQLSEPFLMTNFEHKRVRLGHDADGPVEFTILVDPLGTRKLWKPYQTLTVAPGQQTTHRFPDGFSAHWVRVKAAAACRATAWFVYD
ncbi:MAG: hypothetical protein JXL80_13385 [Planctomycetes bacterium]|nr:hypothetical protein [Planctomycetota bacterium]